MQLFLFFVEIQTHIFIKLSAWNIPTRSKSKIFYFVKNLVSTFVFLINQFYITVRLSLLLLIPLYAIGEGVK